MLGAVVALVVGVSLYFTVLAPQSARAETTSRAALADRDALRKELTDTAIAQRVKLDGISAELTAEKIARAKAESDLEGLSRARRTSSPSVTTARRAATAATPPAPGIPCKPGDPICETIGK